MRSSPALPTSGLGSLDEVGDDPVSVKLWVTGAARSVHERRDCKPVTGNPSA